VGSAAVQESAAGRGQRLRAGRVRAEQGPGAGYGSARGDQERSLLNKPSEGAQVEQQVRKREVGGGSLQAIGPDTFQAQTGDLAIASLHRILACAVVLFPECRVIGIEARQSLVTGTVGMKESTSDVPDHAQWAVRVAERAIGILRLGMRLPGAHLATDPASAQALVVESVEGHAIAVGTQRMTVPVVSTHGARIRVFVSWVVADDDHRDDAVVVEHVQAVRIAHGRIGYELADVHPGQALTEMGIIVRHHDPFITGAGVHGGVGYPGGMELIITEQLRVAAVAIDIARPGGVFLSFLVAAAVVDQACLGVARRGQAALLPAGFLCAATALEPLVLRRTRAGLLRGSGLVTV
jgi:hypothetical protein